MYSASPHLALQQCVLRLSDFPLRHELGWTVGHALDFAFSFAQVFTAASDAASGSLCGNESTGNCNHGSCPKQFLDHATSPLPSCFRIQLLAGPSDNIDWFPIGSGARNELRAMQT
jgi:hypothetical protein